MFPFFYFFSLVGKNPRLREKNKLITMNYQCLLHFLNQTKKGFVFLPKQQKNDKKFGVLGYAGEG